MTAPAPPGPATEPPAAELPFDLATPGHDELRRRVRTWVGAHLRPHAERWEADAGYPKEVFRAAAEAGLFGWKVDGSVGGTGPDFLADAIVTEELAACGSGGVAAGLGAHKDLGPYYLWRFGTPEQHARWVAPAVRGELVGALAVTEPGAGSDVAGLRTRATRDGSDWVLEGTKTFITNGSWADVVVVAAVTDPDVGGHHGQTLFAVEAGDPGCTSRRIDTLGWRTSCTGELWFDRVRLPADRVVGGEAQLGQGFVAIMRNFQWERIGMALGAVRAAEEVLRRGAGLLRPGADTARLEGVAARLLGARALAEDALRRYLHGEDAVREVSMAKRHACVLAVEACEALLTALGSAGVDLPWLGAALRDARLGPIGGGTTEIMDEVVGRTFGL